MLVLLIERYRDGDPAQYIGALRNQDERCLRGFDTSIAGSPRTWLVVTRYWSTQIPRRLKHGLLHGTISWSSR